MNIGTHFYDVLFILYLCFLLLIVYLNFKQNKDTVKELSKIIISIKDKSKEYNAIEEMEKALKVKSSKSNKNPKVKVKAVPEVML